MNLRAAMAWLVAGVLVLSLLVWRSQLFTVQAPGTGPRPLAALESHREPDMPLDVILPTIPTGMRRVRGSDGVLLVHYWAPWEQNSRRQASELDSLALGLTGNGVQVVMVCFDPFPSVARYVARQRLRLPVLLDGRHEMRRVLPCPSIPYTYVLDRSGRIVVAQPGEVDWLSPQTQSTIDALRREDAPPPPGEPPA